MTTKSYKVYGTDGHRQRESFNESYTLDFGKRVIEVLNSDITNTNDYTVVKITCESAEECDKEMRGQISDGIFENSRVGRFEEVHQ